MAEQAKQGQTQPQAKPAAQPTGVGGQGEVPGARAGKSSVAPTAPSAKPAREAVMVKMSDGRQVEFVGKRKLLKETLIEGDKVSVRLDFRNGQTRVFPVPKDLLLKSAGHGMEQKLGDETAGTEDVEDMVVAVDDLIGQLSAGNWSVAREGGGFTGASVVIRAIMEAAGKTQEEVKAFLQKKLDTVTGLTRKQLYDSFRKPGTKTGIIVERLEKEKLVKESKVDADAALAELK